LKQIRKIDIYIENIHSQQNHCNLKLGAPPWGQGATPLGMVLGKQAQKRPPCFISCRFLSDFFTGARNLVLAIWIFPVWRKVCSFGVKIIPRSVTFFLFFPCDIRL